MVRVPKTARPLRRDDRPRAAPRPHGASKPGGATRIYLVRHGRTGLNASGVLRGHLDPPLDAVGNIQAMKLAVVLGGLDLDVVVSSPLRRAVSTALPIADRAGLVVGTDNRLIDRDYGPWAGTSLEAVVGKVGDLDTSSDIEESSKVCTRAYLALSDVAQRAEGGTAVVVSHDAVIRLLLGSIDAELSAFSAVPLETGCFHTLEHRKEGWSVLSINNVPGEQPSKALPR